MTMNQHSGRALGKQCAEISYMCYLISVCSGLNVYNSVENLKKIMYLPSEYRASAASPDILAIYTFRHQKFLPSECRANAASADILAIYTFIKKAPTKLFTA